MNNIYGIENDDTDEEQLLQPEKILDHWWNEDADIEILLRYKNQSSENDQWIPLDTFNKGTLWERYKTTRNWKRNSVPGPIRKTPIVKTTANLLVEAAKNNEFYISESEYESTDEEFYEVMDTDDDDQSVEMLKDDYFF